MRVYQPLILIGLADAVIERLSSSSTVSVPTTSYPPPTYMIWSTNPAGVAVEVPYSQTFSRLWTTMATPKSGAIGLGTIEGEVGTVRTGFATPVSDDLPVETKDS